ncbi:MAG: divergent PAP2 family protein [Bacillota bacterium]
MNISYELISAFSALLIAQLIKVVLDFLLDKRLSLNILFSTGGMPSSHSALTAGLTTAIGLAYGFTSPFFSISLVLTVIVAHDAAGVRWQAGKHASEINKIREDVRKLYKAIAAHEPPEKNIKQLKELLGHKPLEVVMGGILGVFVAYIIWLFSK